MESSEDAVYEVALTAFRFLVDETWIGKGGRAGGFVRFFMAFLVCLVYFVSKVFLVFVGFLCSCFVCVRPVWGEIFALSRPKEAEKQDVTP